MDNIRATISPIDRQAAERQLTFSSKYVDFYSDSNFTGHCIIDVIDKMAQRAGLWGRSIGRFPMSHMHLPTMNSGLRTVENIVVVGVGIVLAGGLLVALSLTGMFFTLILSQ
jgi:hypothetical protein